MDKILNKCVIAETDVNVDPGMGVLTLNHQSYWHKVN